MMEFKFPDLPVSERRREIVAALREHQVVVVVGETGSGKTTQLPKMALMAAGERAGMVGCTQPRRLAAVAVARRIAEELGAEGAGMVGHHVRFDDRTGEDTRIKLMTDGILLAETQQDPDLLAYHTIILDEAHERSLNIDSLLGYLKLLLERRRDLRVIISSATMNAAAFSDFFDGAPIIEVQGRTYPVELHYMPPVNDQEELTSHVARAVEWVTQYDAGGDVLVFLPGEREIRDCADTLEQLELSRTDILPLFARLSLADQQHIFHPAPGRRRIVLATNVAETSLTIPGIMYVIDSGLARVSRYLPGRQIQSLQVEEISRASARQRAGRCGRVAEGVCIRLYSEEDFNAREAYTDPEIRRSALAGVILRMADLRLPPLGKFPLPDPPGERLIHEGYRTLREIGAIDHVKRLTYVGRKLARLPLDPRLGRILLESQKEKAAAEALVLVAGMSIQDPRERPVDHAEEADRAHAAWRHEESDFLSLLQMWRAMEEYRDGRKLRRNALRKWCSAHFLSFVRMVEWHNLEQDLRASLALALRWRVPVLPPPEEQATPERIHRAVLAGAPLQIGCWNKEDKIYRGTAGRSFSIFPGSGLFRRKNRAPWVFGSDLAETSRLWLRRAAVLDPAWVEQVAPQLCTRHAYAPEWDAPAGVVYARERVVCGGLTIVDGRRISYAASHPAEARAIMIRDGILPRKMQRNYPFLEHLEEMMELVSTVENKLRRRDHIRCDDAIYHFFDERIPKDCTCEKDLRLWMMKGTDPHVLDIPYEECIYPGEDDAPEELYPDELHCAAGDYPVYYLHAPGEAEDGVTIGVHIDQLDDFPDWLPSWGVPAHLEQRVLMLLRSLPKADRQKLMPLAESAREFMEAWDGRERNMELNAALAQFVREKTGKIFHPSEFDACRMPPEFVTKIWVCDDEGEELALGTSAAELRERLTSYRERRFRKQAARSIVSTPMTHWDCGELPITLPVGNGIGYPALADEGNRVRVQLCATEEQAGMVHRAGVRRLVMIRCADFLNSLRKRMPIPGGMAAFAGIGMNPRENAEQSIAAATDVSLVPLPRTREDFETACLRVREQAYDTLAGPISRLWEQLAAAQRAIDEFCLTASHHEATERIASDLARQWGWLTRRGFLTESGPGALSDLSRFARGICERLERLSHRAPVDDLSRIDAWERAVALGFYEQYERHAGEYIWQTYGMLAEEYRISLFAPTLARKGRVSQRKLQELVPPGCAAE